MYSLNQSFYARICETDLDFKVASFGLSPAVKCGPLYQVDVALRFITRPVHGSELNLQLLNRNFSPLAKITNSLDLVVLPSLALSGITSVFKSDQFEQAAEPPSYLVITLFGHQTIFPLLQDDDVGKGDVAPVGSPTSPGTTPPTTTPPTTPAPGTTPPGAAPPPLPKCCPNKFTTPNGQLPTTVVDARNNAGAVVGVLVRCQPWVIQASFNDAPPPCRCTCCRYRQRWRGEMKMTLGGVEMDLSPITDYVPAPGPVIPGVPPQLIGQKSLNADNFTEDTLGDVNQPGNPYGYGRRDNTAPRPGGGWLPQDYPTLCTYWGLDSPGDQGLIPKGARLKINVTWEGTILDTCNGNAMVVGPNLWSWIFNGVV